MMVMKTPGLSGCSVPEFYVEKIVLAVVISMAWSKVERFPGSSAPAAGTLRIPLQDSEVAFSRRHRSTGSF